MQTPYTPSPPAAAPRAPGRHPLRRVALLAAAAAAVALAACDRSEDATVGQRVDNTVQSAQVELERAGNRVASGTAEVVREARELGDKAASQAGDAAAKTAALARDASITAAVNAKLAADKELSALQIDVDTLEGRVKLHGTAPTEKARQRATALAASVEGVRSVDNHLQVKTAQRSGSTPPRV